MRVLTLIHLYPPHHLGGYEVACQGAMERFAADGHDVLVLCASWRSDDVEETPAPPRLEVRRQLEGWWDWSSWSPTRPRLRERIAIERNNQKALVRAVEDFRPDVASVWNLSMTTWATATLLERRKIPIVLTFLDDWITYSFVFDAWTRMFERRHWARPLGSAVGLETHLPAFRDASANVASRMIGDSIEAKGRWKFPDAALVPIGVDTRDFPLSGPDDRPWRWRLMYSGRVVTAKGVPTLIRALAEMPDEVTVDVVGHAHPRDLEAMRSVARDLGVEGRITFGRAASRAELRARYRAADLVVFPSEWEEPFGIVPLEAMACAVPVIATGTGGSGEYLVDGENCLLFEPGNATALAGAARRVAEDAELRGRIVSGGSRTAETLTMGRFAGRLEEIHLAALRP